MTNVDIYALGLALAIGVAVLLGSRGLWLAAAVMVVEFAAANGAVVASERWVPIEAFGFIHLIAAWLLLRDNRHTAEVIIGGVYLALFVTDIGYSIRLLASGSANTSLYLNWAAGGGWAQIAVLAAGGLADGPGKRTYIPDFHRGAVAAGAVLAGGALAAGVAHAAGGT